MLDQKSFILGVLTHVLDDADITYKRDRNFYNIYCRGAALGWIAEEEIKWILEKFGFDKLRNSAEIEEAVATRYKAAE